jgi:hypothetical protein
MGVERSGEVERGKKMSEGRSRRKKKPTNADLGLYNIITCQDSAFKFK